MSALEKALMKNRSISVSIVILSATLLILDANAEDININKTDSAIEQEVGDTRYISNEDGTVVDVMLGLMWAANDNGKLIAWEDALEYCNRLKLGGYSDWRMPTLQELATLYVANKPNPNSPTEDCLGGYYIRKYFHITCCCLWAKEETGRRASYPFNTMETFWHHKSAFSGKRVLPVRKIKIGE